MLKIYFLIRYNFMDNVFNVLRKLKEPIWLLNGPILDQAHKKCIKS